jgi:hypothetical protein
MRIDWIGKAVLNSAAMAANLDCASGTLPRERLTAASNQFYEDSRPFKQNSAREIYSRKVIFRPLNPSQSKQRQQRIPVEWRNDSFRPVGRVLPVGSFK